MKFVGLKDKIDKSLQVIDEAVEQFPLSGLALAWTGGKDSTVLLHLVRSYFSGKVPVPVFFNDSTLEFAEVYSFIERLQAEWDLKLIRVKPLATELAQLESRSDQEKSKLVRKFKVTAIRRAIDRYGFEAFLVGIRWDEHVARSQEKYISSRRDHERIHPLLHFTERDIWHYIRTRNVPYVKLYDQGYRSLGEAPFTRPTPQDGGERAGRDADKEKILRRLRNLGYW